MGSEGQLPMFTGSTQHVEVCKGLRDKNDQAARESEHIISGASRLYRLPYLY